MAPSNVELLGRGREGLLEVSEGEEVTLECRVEDAKPVADVVWFKNDQEIHLGESIKSLPSLDVPLNRWLEILSECVSLFSYLPIFFFLQLVTSIFIHMSCVRSPVSLFYTSFIALSFLS